MLRQQRASTIRVPVQAQAHCNPVLLPTSCHTSRPGTGPNIGVSTQHWYLGSHRQQVSSRTVWAALNNKTMQAVTGAAMCTTLYPLRAGQRFHSGAGPSKRKGQNRCPKTSPSQPRKNRVLKVGGSQSCRMLPRLPSATAAQLRSGSMALSSKVDRKVAGKLICRMCSAEPGWTYQACPRRQKSGHQMWILPDSLERKRCWGVPCRIGPAPALLRLGQGTQAWIID